MKKNAKTIALDCRPLTDASRMRGIGNMVRYLVPELARQWPNMVLYADNATDEIRAFGLPVIEKGAHASMAEALSGQAVDHVHFMAQYNVPLDFPLPHTITVHDVFNVYRGVNDKKDMALQRKLVRRLQGAKKLFCISRFTRDELVTRHGISVERCCVIYPGVAKLLSSGPQTPVFPFPYILTVGNFEARKNQPNMIRAAMALNARRAEKIHYVAVQSRGHLFPVLQAQLRVALAGQGSYFHFLGWVSNDVLTSLYRHTRLFCFVSAAEGFGLPLLEAMQFDIPILTSATSALPEVGQDAVYYADPTNVDDIARQMERCLALPPLTVDQRVRRDAIRESFNFVKMAREMAAEFAKVLDVIY